MTGQSTAPDAGPLGAGASRGDGARTSPLDTHLRMLMERHLGTTDLVYCFAGSCIEVTREGTVVFYGPRPEDALADLAEHLEEVDRLLREWEAAREAFRRGTTDYYKVLDAKRRYEEKLDSLVSGIIVSIEDFANAMGVDPKNYEFYNIYRNRAEPKMDTVIGEDGAW